METVGIYEDITLLGGQGALVSVLIVLLLYGFQRLQMYFLRPLDSQRRAQESLFDSQDPKPLGFRV